MTKKCVRLTVKKREKLMRDFCISTSRLKCVYDSLGACVKKGEPLGQEVLFNCWLTLSDVYRTMSILSREKLIVED